MNQTRPDVHFDSSDLETFYVVLHAVQALIPLKHHVNAVESTTTTMSYRKHGVRIESCFKETALKDVEASIKYHVTVSSVVLCL